MMKKLRIAQFLILLIIIPSCLRFRNEPLREPITYPVTKKVDVADDYFGTIVADPYRWLEDDQSDEVRKWIDKQNRATFAYLNNIPFREQIRRRLREIYNYPKYSSPFRAGDYYFFYKNNGLQDQSVIYVRKGIDGEPDVFIDPNALSTDGTIRVNLVGFSKDNRYVTISQSEAGSDWRELKVMEIATKKELTDRIRWVKFSGAAWLGEGFYYSGYDKPEQGQELTARNKYQKVFYHKLGDSQENDRLVYEDVEHPFRYKWADVTEDGRFLILYVSEGTHGNEVYYKNLVEPDMELQPLITGFQFNNHIITNVEDKFLTQTNTDADNKKVILIDPKNKERDAWKTIIPEKEEVLKNVSTVGSQLFCVYLQDATTRVYQYNFDGSFIREIKLPAPGRAGGFHGKKEHDITFYSFTSFTYPPVIYKYDIATGNSEIFHKTEVKFKPEDYETRQVFYSSKDGTQVPMFIVHKKGLQLNGRNPAYLHGYGGFNATMLPHFNATNIILLENGGVYALANLRGGGEYGEEWHRAGMLRNKQNVFDDFIAAAEYLIDLKYTSRDKLAIAGGSNGGLLVGACMTQRPDLFRVAFPAVGVMDMLRYHKFTVGWGWVVEYGSSDDEEHFHNLYLYSPLHNIRKNVSYPATLVTTADHDDRVVPAHSFKFIATLQEKYRGENPVLIRIETRSGHGSSNTTKKIDQITDKWAFMFHNLGVQISY